MRTGLLALISPLLHEAQRRERLPLPFTDRRTGLTSVRPDQLLLPHIQSLTPRSRFEAFDPFKEEAVVSSHLSLLPPFILVLPLL